MFREHSILRYFLLALAFFVVIRLFFFDFSAVRDDSMSPGIVDGDILLIARSAYRIRLPFGGGNLLTHDRPKHGAVVVLTAAGVPGKLIKRVVALAGDTLRFEERRLYCNGLMIRFFSNRLSDPFNGKTLKIPPNHVFVLGDNSDNSMDSMDFGPVPETRIIGKAIVRFFPVSRAGKVN